MATVKRRRAAWPSDSFAAACGVFVGLRPPSARLGRCSSPAAEAAASGRTPTSRRDNFSVEVVDATFPTQQRLAEQVRLRLRVRNADSKTIPNLAVTVDGFSRRSEQQGLADPSRPVWIIDDGPRGGVTAYSSTWALGKVKAGETKEFVWRVTPVKAGDFEVSYRVAAGLDGKAKAVLMRRPAALGQVRRLGHAQARRRPGRPEYGRGRARRRPRLARTSSSIRQGLRHWRRIAVVSNPPGGVRVPRRIDAGEVLAAIGGLMVFVALFLSWFDGASAWEAFEALDLILALLALAAVAAAIGSVTDWSGAPSPRLLPVLGALLLAIVVVQLIEPPPVFSNVDPDREAGRGSRSRARRSSCSAGCCARRGSR